MGEIIFFIAIVVILAFKLYSLFGNRGNDSDADEELREKYSRYIWFFENDEDKHGEKVVNDSESGDTIDIVTENDSQESSEHSISQKVRLFFNDFNIDKFKRSVSIVYEMLFTALKTGEFKDIKNLVTDEILKQLKSTFSAFKEKDECLVNTNIDIQQITLSDVQVDDDITLTVDIVVKRCCYVQSIDGKTIQKGSDDKLLTFNEIWKFKKSKNSSDPVWFVSYIDQK